MGKTIVDVMMTGLESIMQFVTGGRIFVCAVLAVLFLPITLGVCTLLVVLLPIWFTLHLHLAIGAAVAVVMVVLAYRNIQRNIIGPKYQFSFDVYGYGYAPESWSDKEYKFMITKTDKSCYYCILRAPYAILLSAHTAIITALFVRRWPSRSSKGKPWVCDNYTIREVLTGIAWSWPAYIALGLGVVMAAAYFLSTLICGNADTFVSDFIHGPWLYLAGK